MESQTPARAWAVHSGNETVWSSLSRSVKAHHACRWSSFGWYCRRPLAGVGVGVGSGSRPMLKEAYRLSWPPQVALTRVGDPAGVREIGYLRRYLESTLVMTPNGPTMYACCFIVPRPSELYLWI